MKLGFYKELAREVWGKHVDINVDTVQALFKEKDGVLYIVFKGTDGFKDWVNNFMFAKKDIPYDNTATKIRVHGGWISQYKQDGVRNVLLEKAKDYKKVVVVGHSYGAALAILCSVDLQYNYPDKQVFAVPLSTPRVGNKAFVDSYEKRVKYFSGYIGNDIVHKVAPYIFGFRHIKGIQHFGHRNPLKVILNTFLFLVLFFINIENIDILGDHDIWRDGKYPSKKYFSNKPMPDDIEVGF